ncbi:MAG: hypothetical protein KC619_03640 [Myxococcales bacterium]|nr:hypothetical protein [Myxococcales bacterium]
MRVAALGLALMFAAGLPGLARAQDGARDAVPEAPSVELRPATVRFRASLEGVHVLYMQDPVLEDSPRGLAVRPAPIGRYAELCVAPCDVELPQTHLALAARFGEHAQRFAEPLGVDGPTGVRIAWDDRTELRIAGVITLIAGSVVGLAVGGLSLGLATDDVALAGGAATGSALIGGSVVVGLVLALMDDGARVTVTPLPDDGGALFSSEWR